MTIEEKLAELIELEFGSIAECARQTGVHDSTIRTILKRGVKKAHVDNLFPITRALGISAEHLYYGEIVMTDNVGRNLDELLVEFEEKLRVRTYVFNQHAVSPDDIEEVIDAIEYVRMRFYKRFK